MPVRLRQGVQAEHLLTATDQMRARSGNNCGVDMEAPTSTS